MFESVVGVGYRLTGIVDRLDPDAVPGPPASQLWTAFDRIERLAAAGKTLLARRLADTHRPERAGVKTAAEDLARRAGTTVGAARDALEVSTRLRELPQVEAAVRRGELSPAQTAAVSAAAAAHPGTERRLVELAATASLPELREECARVKAAADADPEATNQRLHRGRRLRRFTGPDGAWTLVATGTPQAGAVINTALDPIIDQIFRTARREGRHEPYEAHAFDALVALAERPNGTPVAVADAAGTVHRFDSRLGSAAPPAIDNQPAAAATAGTLTPVGTTPPGRVNPRYLALLRIDLEALRRGAVAGGQLCEIAGVGPVPVSVAQQLLGEAVLKLVITRGVDVLSVTHLGRGPSAAQRLALAWTSPGCTVEGCWRTRIEYDHRLDWKDTRRTRLDELDPFCHHHHDLKTHHGWALVPGHGKRPMVPPDDPRHPRHQTSRRRGEERDPAIVCVAAASLPSTPAPAAFAQPPLLELRPSTADPPRAP